MQKIRKGDKVIVTAGKDKGQTGEVIQVLPAAEKVLVSNVNMVKRHTKPNPMADQPGGIIEKPMPLHRSNVMLVNPATNKADRIGIKTLDDGKKVRYFKSNGDVLDA